MFIGKVGLLTLSHALRFVPGLVRFELPTFGILVIMLHYVAKTIDRELKRLN